MASESRHESSGAFETTDELDNTTGVLGSEESAGVRGDSPSATLLPIGDGGASLPILRAYRRSLRGQWGKRKQAQLNGRKDGGSLFG